MKAPALPQAVHDCVTWKWAAVFAIGLLSASVALGWNAHSWAADKFERKAEKAAVALKADKDDLARLEKLYNDDIKFIKECLVTRCWDNPPRTP